VGGPRDKPCAPRHPVFLTAIVDVLDGCGGTCHKNIPHPVSRPTLTPIPFIRLLPPEIFNEKDCPHDDLWPCKEAEVESARALFGSPSEAPQGSPPRLQWSALEWKSAPLTPTPFATSSIDPNRDLAVGRDDEAPLQRGATGQADRNGSTASASHAASDANDGATLGRGQTIMAERAESCAHACEKIGLRCSLVGLRELNSCDAVRRHLQCLKGCEGSVGGESHSIFRATSRHARPSLTCITKYRPPKPFRTPSQWISPPK